jgi:hypothetical protein
MSTPSTRPFPPRRDYTSLSVRDLLDAREAYHVYLSTLDTVVATAIGRYLIRKNDWYADHSPDNPRPPGVRKPTGARTLDNSVVRPWSWPCVLVFVREWIQPGSLGAQEIPRALFLADGRVVPTCVVLAEPDESLPPPVPGPSQVTQMLGGGFACARKHQDTIHAGTIACLVTREGSYYALTNRHVAGIGGEEVQVYSRGALERVGAATDIGLGELRMSEAFPAWPGDRTYLTIDAGLIRVDDITEWTSQAFGIGEIGEPFDATEQSVSLDLIGVPMRAYGGVSGVIEGEIRALFFRYESLGGVDRATDVLIGPRTEDTRRATSGVRTPTADAVAPVPPPFTRPGDSGTLWFYDPPTHGDMHEDVGGHMPPECGKRARRLRPVAMQWGGERFKAGNGSSAYALGTFLSTIVRELHVDIVRDWSTGHDEYWGKIGHFAVGWKACEFVGGALGKLMKANQARIGYGDDTLKAGSEFRQGREGFVPLADVPDYVWISSRPTEPVQHFADIDIQDIDGGKSLLERCHANPADVSAPVWKQFFDGFAAAGVGPDEGTLPFRVWQIWDAMVSYLPQKETMRFVAAAGVLAHYVGDASQPLHCSYMHHGIPPMIKHQGRLYPPRKKLKGQKGDNPAYVNFHKTRDAKIHGIYEEQMLEVDPAAALADVNKKAANLKSDAASIRSGHDAAVAVVELMYQSQKRLPPKTIIKADDPSNTAKQRAANLWANKTVRDGTTASLAASVRLLADLWESAWREGGGNTIAAGKIRGFEEADLDAVYRRDKSFVPSYSLAKLAANAQFTAPAAAKKKAAKKGAKKGAKKRR